MDNSNKLVKYFLGFSFVIGGLSYLYYTYFTKDNFEKYINEYQNYEEIKLTTDSLICDKCLRLVYISFELIPNFISTKCTYCNKFDTYEYISFIDKLKKINNPLLNNICDNCSENKSYFLVEKSDYDFFTVCKKCINKEKYLNPSKKFKLTELAKHGLYLYEKNNNLDEIKNVESLFLDMRSFLIKNLEKIKDYEENLNQVELISQNTFGKLHKNAEIKLAKLKIELKIKKTIIKSFYEYNNFITGNNIISILSTILDLSELNLKRGKNYNLKESYEIIESFLKLKKFSYFEKLNIYNELFDEYKITKSCSYQNILDENKAVPKPEIFDNAYLNVININLENGQSNIYNILADYCSAEKITPIQFNYNKVRKNINEQEILIYNRRNDKSLYYGIYNTSKKCIIENSLIKLLNNELDEFKILFFNYGLDAFIIAKVNTIIKYSYIKDFRNNNDHNLLEFSEEHFNFETDMIYNEIGVVLKSRTKIVLISRKGIKEIYLGVKLDNLKFSEQIRMNSIIQFSILMNDMEKNLINKIILKIIIIKFLKMNQILDKFITDSSFHNNYINKNDNNKENNFIDSKNVLNAENNREFEEINIIQNNNNRIDSDNYNTINNKSNINYINRCFHGRSRDLNNPDAFHINNENINLNNMNIYMNLNNFIYCNLYNTNITNTMSDNLNFMINAMMDSMFNNNNMMIMPNENNIYQMIKYINMNDIDINMINFNIMNMFNFDNNNINLNDKNITNLNNNNMYLNNINRSNIINNNMNTNNMNIPIFNNNSIGMNNFNMPNFNNNLMGMNNFNIPNFNNNLMGMNNFNMHNFDEYKNLYEINIYNLKNNLKNLKNIIPDLNLNLFNIMYNTHDAHLGDFFSFNIIISRLIKHISPLAKYYVFFEFPRNLSITIQKYFIEVLKINENYFIITSIEMTKCPNEKKYSIFYISLYNFKSMEETTKIEVDKINNEFGLIIHEHTINSFKIKKEKEDDNKFLIMIQSDDITKYYKYEFVENQLIKMNI